VTQIFFGGSVELGALSVVGSNMNKNEDPNIARLSSDTPAGRLMLLRELGPQPVFDEDGNVIGET
jgi:hypothetical protein